MRNNPYRNGDCLNVTLSVSDIRALFTIPGSRFTAVQDQVLVPRAAHGIPIRGETAANIDRAPAR